MADNLKAMLSEAKAQKAAVEAQRRAEDDKRKEETAAAGIALRERVLPRLEAAEEAWADEIRLTITDNTAEFDVTSARRRTYPRITFSVSKGTEFAGYTIEAYSSRGVGITDDGDRGNGAYEFNIKTVDDVTDDVLDKMLQKMIRKVHGLR